MNSRWRDANSCLTLTKSMASAGGESGVNNNGETGAVTIIDYFHAGEGELNLRRNNVRHDAVIAHFVAHQHSPVASMFFSPDGNLLFSACQEGQQFHVFRIAPHPGGSSLAAVQHLYILYRGGTMSKVQEVTFSPDNRWIAVCTYRGTCHLFPINPYGGVVSARTHLSDRVVNRISHFQKSAGLDEIIADVAAATTNSQSTDPSARSLSPTTTASAAANDAVPGATLANNGVAATSTLNSALKTDLNGTRAPLVVEPMAQIKHGSMVPAVARAALPGTSGGSSSNGGSVNMATRWSGGGSSGSGSSANDSAVSISAFFSCKRVKLPASTQLIDKKGITYTDGLYIVSSHGTLVEYLLHPYPTKLTAKKKIPEDAPVALGLEACIQWQLSRQVTSSEFAPPLSEANPLLQIGRLQYDRSSGSGADADDASQQRSNGKASAGDSSEAWLAQVEICTHQGPSRRLWMGPQFEFKTYRTSAVIMAPDVANAAVNAAASVSSSSSPSAIMSNVSELNLASLKINPVRSQPINMPKQRFSGGSARTPTSFTADFGASNNSVEDASSLSSTEGMRMRLNSSGASSALRATTIGGGGSSSTLNNGGVFDAAAQHHQHGGYENSSSNAAAITGNGRRGSSSREAGGLTDTIADAMLDDDTGRRLLSPSLDETDGGLPLDMLTRDDVVEEIKVPPHPTPPQSVSSTLATTAAVVTMGNHHHHHHHQHQDHSTTGSNVNNNGSNVKDQNSVDVGEETNAAAAAAQDPRRYGVSFYYHQQQHQQ